MELILDYKDRLRRVMLNYRDRAGRELLNNLSNVIQNKVLSLDKFRDAKIVGAYHPIGSEVDTRKILEFTLKHKILALPKVDKEIVFRRVDSLNSLVRGRYNIMEPSGEMIEPDLVLVPAIAFDREGYRIGYGKGYYDIYLSKHDIFSIGLAYDFQVLNSIPHDDHDVRVKMVVTDKKILVS